jgi:hypothetical protein
MPCEGTECHALCLEQCSDESASAGLILYPGSKEMKQKPTHYIFTTISNDKGSSNVANWTGIKLCKTKIHPNSI